MWEIEGILYDNTEIVATLLKEESSNFILWSDGTVTKDRESDKEYIVSETKKDCFMGMIGMFKGLYIYFN
jgi:hypothetical protein